MSAEGEPAAARGPAVLGDLPSVLWRDLARSFRRAVEPLEDGELPPALRPFRGWKPDRLLAERPRRALAEALGDDARLRAALGEELGDEQLRARWAAQSRQRLVADLGERRAAAVLTALARWDDLAALSADVAAREAAQHRAAGEAQPSPEAEDGHAIRARLQAEADELRAARDEERRARDRAEAHARTLRAERDELAATVRELEDRIEELERSIRDERARHRDRLERLRRRAAEAEAHGRVDDDRIRTLAARLDETARELREALGDEVIPEPSQAPAGDPASAKPPPQATGPRLPTALPGRPCGLPAGLTREDADGVRSLLAVPGILLLLDGYNVSKDPRGVPSATLADQRQWLVRLASGVFARYRTRTIVVFDSDVELEAPLPATRGVVVDFATDQETADDRIVGLLEGLDAGQPVVVVTSDRELAGRCDALGADVVPSRSFLAATT